MKTSLPAITQKYKSKTKMHGFANLTWHSVHFFYFISDLFQILIKLKVSF